MAERDQLRVSVNIAGGEGLVESISKYCWWRGTLNDLSLFSGEQIFHNLISDHQNKLYFVFYRVNQKESNCMAHLNPFNYAIINEQKFLKRKLNVVKYP